ncbi:ExeM/NucH family extracellular endonuclease [Agromyces aerolatus]|uniref:ExeM/NucH family extracellular endonuclease n=1 Tax=Agromyces sp. LY-1074 TaxID=3074080 RepID=UPI0028544078|nr:MULTISPECIES: ExeM/NucH family extracellular endonuclease [unclassified Agromyces]MDR5700974.1 ExeM/NucH family extracellular endonuclease [Agromyces sp. LY-1074]MDR5707365.1 ExeM/NucH family extracellular endonuclease [Agromyces sp. LY-1358]
MPRSVRRSTVAVVAAAVLGAGVLAAAPPAAAESALAEHPVINEFSASTAGTDVEYVELLAAPGADLSTYRVLEIEGDAPVFGVVDEVISFGAPDADGRALASLPANALENGTMSLLLVTGEGFPALGTDLDADDDGVIDDTSGLTVVDSIAVHDGGAGDRAYGPVTLGVSYDGQPFAPGGASRIPDGVDADATGDWVRNDFDLAGIPGQTGTLTDGEAVNTPGAENTTEAGGGPDPVEADCEASVVPIGSVQGAGDASPIVSATVEVEGVVVGDFQDGGFDGYYLQDAGDGDPATSDGVFVYSPGGMDVASGDVVHVVGTVGEYFGLTQVTASAVAVCETGAAPPEATVLELPLDPAAHEAFEGMLVTLPQTLVIGETFEYGRYGQVSLSTTRLDQPTAVAVPGSTEALAIAEANLRDAIVLDDGRGRENPDPAIHPNGEPFTIENTFRSGDLVTGATGVLDYRFDTWAVQPTQGADFEVANPRPAVPDVGGDLKVASFNVLNYFTSLDGRGADTPEEFARQQAKIVAALAEIDADVVGLIEIENNGTAVQALAGALNAAVGDSTYAAIETGVLGTDEITTALIYKPAAVTPQGAFQSLDTADDPRFLDDFNRPALAQTFASTATGETVTVVVNHLKSKGSGCEAVGDPLDPNGQGNCNGVRTEAAAAMADWLAGDPTGQGAGRELIIGDLNAYDYEDPIATLTGAGYTDLVKQFQGDQAYSYIFDGWLGYLDHALAGSALAPSVTGAAVWHINADEPSLIDYDMTFKQPAQDALFAPDAFRSSDHDPVIVGLALTPPDTVAPELDVDAHPSRILIPTGGWRTVNLKVDATDDSGEVTVELVSAEAHGSSRADIQQLSDTKFKVRAVLRGYYTFEYRATDAAGNTTTATETVNVGLRGLWLFDR